MAISLPAGIKLNTTLNTSGLNTNTGTNFAPYKAPAPVYKPPVVNNITPQRTTTQTSYSGSGAPSSAVQQTQQSNGYSQLQDQQAQINQQIENDFNNAMGILGSSESGLRTQAGMATSQIDTGAGDVSNQIQNNQSVATNAVDNSVATARTLANQGSMQARDVFRQTQQGNQAQLSALGISSSSVQEALAEKLGVETARRIAGISDSLSTVQQNAINEIGRIRTYYEGQRTTLAKQVQDQKSQIQYALTSGLDKINQSRFVAAQDKASARQSLLSQVTQSIASLTQQQQQFEQSLALWKEQKQAALTPVAQDPNYIQNLINTANTFNQQFQPTGFQYLPQINVNAQGTYSGQITPKVKPVYDANGNIISQAAAGDLTSPY